MRSPLFIGFLFISETINPEYFATYHFHVILGCSLLFILFLWMDISQVKFRVFNK